MLVTQHLGPSILALPPLVCGGVFFYIQWIPKTAGIYSILYMCVDLYSHSSDKIEFVN